MALPEKYAGLAIHTRTAGWTRHGTARYDAPHCIHALRVGHDTVRHGTTRYDAPHCYTHWVSGTQWVGVGVRWVETARWAEEEAEFLPGRGQGPREGGSLPAIGVCSQPLPFDPCF